MCARIAEDKKGRKITVLDMKEVFPMADFFVLATGANRKHIQTIADEIKRSLKEKNTRPISVEGYSQAWWILMDYGDVILHVFAKDARDYYDIENLWGDAEIVDWTESEPGRRAG